VASRQLRKAGRVTRFEPVAVVASPMDFSWWQMFSFLRRQYLVARYYVPMWWALGLCVSTLANVLWLASGAILVRGLLYGSSPWWLPVGLCTTVYLLSVQRGAVRQSLVQTYFPQYYSDLRKARRFDIWASPLVNFVNWLGMASSMFGRHICWRGLKYRMLRGGRIGGVQRAQGFQIYGQTPQASDEAREARDERREIRDGNVDAPTPDTRCPSPLACSRAPSAAMPSLDPTPGVFTGG
jgi:hypothetical protein